MHNLQVERLELTYILMDLLVEQISDNNFTIVKRPTGSTTWADWDAFDGTTDNT